ncbi:MAG: NAD-dependent epimerase/dehydratase family protein [Candidatus Aminicenantes bacterium]
MKAFVAGGTGFIGSHIVRDLLAKGIQVRVLVRERHTDRRLQKERGMEWVRGDVLEKESLQKWTKDVDLVFSAFGVLGGWRIPEKAYWDINFKGVQNLMQSCLHTNIKQFIHLSSAGVLGPLSNGVKADESYPFNPSNIYEETKCEAEKEIMKYGARYAFPFTIIRPEFVYGPGDTHVLGLFQALAERRFAFMGKGESLLHPTYIDDLIEGISLCTDNEKALGEIFLIAGGRPLEVKEFVGIMAEEMDVPLPKIRIPLFIAHAAARMWQFLARSTRSEPPITVSRVKFFSQNRAFSIEKAREVLGYTPKISFREGVRRTVHWYRQNHYM